MEALLSETAFGRLDSLEASPGVDASSESPQSGRIRSPATSTIGLAEGFGLKFGDVPTRSTAPAFSFGSGNRQTRAKCYYTGDLNKEMSGRSSPGPVTALQDMAKDAVSNWDAPPNFSFGGKNVGRNKLLQQSCMVGPAQYGGVDAVGEQASSMCATAPIIGFGSAERRHIDFQRAALRLIEVWCHGNMQRPGTFQMTSPRTFRTTRPRPMKRLVQSILKTQIWESRLLGASFPPRKRMLQSFVLVHRFVIKSQRCICHDQVLPRTPQQRSTD